MKKNQIMQGLSPCVINMLKIMKLSVFMLIPFIGAFASEMHSQTTKLSYKVEKKIRLEDFLMKIEDQSDYHFFYTGEIDVDKNVSGEFKNKKINEILDDIKEEAGIQYEVRGKQIILSPKDSKSAIKSIQQQKTISGTVTDKAGLPLPGVTVLVNGTTNGTVTNMDGKYTITNVDENASLQFSYIGMLAQVVKVGGQTTINIVMVMDAFEINEVVVVGYGVQKKSVTTAAISKVDATQILNAQPVRIEDALQGKVSGVQITTNSGQPGAASVVRIRGTGTINNSNPLYIVDGMPVEGGIDYLNPSDIESVEVLKDAASAAIYGARAANGVILVTTKKGKIGKTTVSYNFSYGWQNPWRKVDVLNASEYETIINESLDNAGLAPLFQNPGQAGKGTNWQDAIFYKNAPKVEHQVSVSGGNEKNTHFLSFGYLNQDGIVAEGKSNYNRYNIRYNNSYNLIKNEGANYLRNVVLGVNMGYSRTLSSKVEPNDEYDGLLMSAIASPPNQPIYQDDPAIIAAYNEAHPGQILVSKLGRTYYIGNDNQEIVNPLLLAEISNNRQNSDKIVSSFYLESELMKGLKFRTSYDIDLNFWGYTIAKPAYYISVTQNNELNSISTGMNRGFAYNWENTLSYTLSKGKHNLSVLAGTTKYKYTTADVNGSNVNLQTFNPNMFYLNYALGTIGNQASWGGAYNHTLMSNFGRVTYNFDEKYLLEGVLRADGSSNFGADNQWGYFPSVSAGWVLTRESFLDDTLPWLDFLKLRASYGVNGNENIGAFQYTSLMSSGNNYSIGNGTDAQIQPGIVPSQLVNPEVKWEKSTQTDIGIDARLFKNKLSITADYFSKKTTGMLMTMPIPSYVGNAAPVGNVGSMTNEGFEFELSYKLNVNDFKFQINANASHVNNHVDDLGTASGTIFLESLATQGFISIHQNGQPANSFYGAIAQGVFQNQGEIDAYVNSQGQKIQPTAVPGDVRFSDINGDGSINDQDRTIIGNPNPSWTFGLTFNAEYKGLDFMMFWSGVEGNEIFDGTHRNDLGTVNYNKDILGRWTGEGTSFNLPRVVYGGAEPNNNQRPSTLNIHDGDYLRLKALQVGYTLPSSLTSKFFVSRLRLFANVNNLLTITSYKGFDPEIGANLGIDKGIYPQARTFSLGGNITF